MRTAFLSNDKQNRKRRSETGMNRGSKPPAIIYDDGDMPPLPKKRRTIQHRELGNVGRSIAASEAIHRSEEDMVTAQLTDNNNVKHAWPTIDKRCSDSVFTRPPDTHGTNATNKAVSKHDAFNYIVPKRSPRFHTYSMKMELHTKHTATLASRMRMRPPLRVKGLIYTIVHAR